MNRSVWSNQGNTWMLRDSMAQKGTLPPYIYQLSFHPEIGFYLEGVGEQFSLPSKVYGIEDKFVNRVIKTYKDPNEKGNLAALLAGLRGTGKTVTAKRIANEAVRTFNLPVILVTSFFEGMPNFVRNIEQDFCLFIDEYEKIYHKRDDSEVASMLTLMDGVYTTETRNLFLLTCNEKTVNENFLDRPTRIRYVKDFEKLPESIVREIVSDVLIRKEHEEELLKILSKTEMLTIDTVIAFTKEVNIHGDDYSPTELFVEFNAKEKVSYFTAYKQLIVTEGMKEEAKTKAQKDRLEELSKRTYVGSFRNVQPDELDPAYVGCNLRLGRRYVGEITEYINEENVVVTTNEVEGTGSRAKQVSRQYIYTITPEADSWSPSPYVSYTRTIMTD